MQTSLSNGGRPRLTPGVPAGGVAAILVTIATVAMSIILGPSDQDGGQRLMTVLIPSIAPPPPVPPIPPVRAMYPVPRHGHAGVVDMRGISRAANAGSEEAARLAVALAEAMDGSGGDVTILERSENFATGGNRVVAEAVAPAGLRLANLHGQVTIRIVPDADRIRVEMVNSRRRYDLNVRDGLLRISGPGPSNQPADFTITMPPRGALLINDFSGDLTVRGALDGPVRLDLVQGTIAINGPVQSVRARISGSGSVDIADVRDLLAVQIRGSGKVAAGNANRLHAEIDGSGNMDVGAVRAETVLDIPGRGNVNIGNAAGIFRVAHAGSGDVTVSAGQVDLFEVGNVGSGNVRFGGTAARPRVLLGGRGDVTLAGHTGAPVVQRTGTGRIEMGH